MRIDSNGIQLDSFSDIFNDLVTRFKTIYGEDINLDQDTADGQQVGIFANALYDLQTLIAKIYNSFDPDFAEGHELDKILKLIASSRLPATKSTVDLEITVSANVTLPSDYTVKDDNGKEWIITQSVDLIAGANTVSFEAKDWGAISAQANTITSPVTILTEVTSVTNPAPAVEGRDEESDIELRKRRNKLIGYRANSLISSILGKLLNLDGVADAVVYENKEDTTDTAKSIAPHTLWVIVDGGDISQIAEVIATDKSIGCGLKGAIEATYTETFIRSNGTERIHYHNVKFDRPVETDIFVRFNVTKRQLSDIIDTDAIKNVLAALRFNIAQDITATELYATIYSAGNNFIASSLELSLDGTTWVSDLLSAGYDERLIITTANITITEI